MNVANGEEKIDMANADSLCVEAPALFICGAGHRFALPGFGTACALSQ
jgi:hypothetical protein